MPFYKGDFSERCSMNIIEGFTTYPFNSKRKKELIDCIIELNEEDDEDGLLDPDNGYEHPLTVPVFCQLSGDEVEVWDTFLISLGFRKIYNWFNPNHDYITKNALYVLKGVGLKGYKTRMKKFELIKEELK